MMRPDLAAYLQPVHNGHRVVDDGYVRFDFQGERNGIPAVGRFPAHDPVVASCYDRAKPEPHDFMVVRNQNLLHSAVPMSWNHWLCATDDKRGSRPIDYTDRRRWR
jgi:hypothetical protein